MTTPLIFQRKPSPTPTRLVFGETLTGDVSATLDATLPGLSFAAVVAGVVAGDSVATVDATLPALSFVAQVGRQTRAAVDVTLPAVAFSALIAKPVTATMDATLPGMSFVASVDWNVYCERPTVGASATGWQAGERRPRAVESAHSTAQRSPLHAGLLWGRGERAHSGVTPGHARALRLQNERAAPWGRGVAAGRVSGARWQDALRDRRTGVVAPWGEGVGVETSALARWQDMLRDRRPSAIARYQNGAPRRAGHGSDWQTGIPVRVGERGRYQEGMRPPPGYRAPPKPPVPDPCYFPDTRLVFRELAATATTRLVFRCDRHDPITPVPTTIVVPVLHVYMVTNSITLKRVSDGANVPVLAASVSMDVDSWAWSFSLTLPGEALALVQRSAGATPVELDLTVNGQRYRFLAERIARSRQFARSSITVSGRGRSALLAAPYAPAGMTFSGASAMTAQQLMLSALTENGVSLGWTVDWRLTDWSVPAGVWTKQGTYMDAVTEIAAAAGGYVLPHETNDDLMILPRYSTAPWDWASVTPDYQLPSAVVSVEGVEWQDKPAYNAVYVSGTTDGVLGQVTRSGTAGNLLAPMVTDSLITDAAAARQRGLRVLADTGAQAMVTLRLPVLASTGIIRPGKFVRYVADDATRIGVVRSLQVDCGLTDTWQTLGVETHV